MGETNKGKVGEKERKEKGNMFLAKWIATISLRSLNLETIPLSRHFMNTFYLLSLCSTKPT
jgi:hypothetical protein